MRDSALILLTLNELEGAAEVDLAAVEIAAPHQRASEVVVDGRGVRVVRAVGRLGDRQGATVGGDRRGEVVAKIGEVGEVGERVTDHRVSGAEGRLADSEDTTELDLGLIERARLAAKPP